MMTPGGEHAEEDIPSAIQRAQKRHAALKFIYAWPFKAEDVARFLAIQVEQLSQMTGDRLRS
jgi:sirohydrochlorin cobaltochelatase